MTFGLKLSVIQQINAVLARYPQVEIAILYGSRAKGSAKRGSDIDLTLVGKQDLTLKILYQIIDEIDDLYLPYTVDLSIHSQISDADLLDHIRRVGMAFYEKQEEPHETTI